MPSKSPIDPPFDPDEVELRRAARAARFLKTAAEDAADEAHRLQLGERVAQFIEFVDRMPFPTRVQMLHLLARHRYQAGVLRNRCAGFFVAAGGDPTMDELFADLDGRLERYIDALRLCIQAMPTEEATRDPYDEDLPI